MVSDHVSAADAYAPIMPKQDLGERARGLQATLKLDGGAAVYPGTIGPPGNFALMPPEACVEPGQSVLFSAMPETGPTPFAPCVTYNWTNTAIAGHLTGGSQSTPETLSSTYPTATYTRTAATDADTVGVTVVDVNSTELGTAMATVLAATDPRCMTTTTSTTETTTSTSTTTTTMCTLPPPVISRCGDFTISPPVVPLRGTFTLSIDYTSGGGAPCNASACIGCGVVGNLQMIDGAPAADPLQVCGLTPGTHTAVVQAVLGPVCGAACHFGEPGNWVTTHYFIIGE